MSLYRCAVCGSGNVVPETKQEGYNKKKGIMGMALFGLGGAVAGTSGNTVVYYHCAACGHTLNRCMSEIDKKFLEQYLLEPTKAANMNMLRNYKKQYPNIEWEEPVISAQSTSNFDDVIRENEVTQSMEEDVLAAITEIGKPCLISEIQQCENCQKYNVQSVSIITRALVKKNKIVRIEENRKAYFTIKAMQKSGDYYSIAVDVLEVLYLDKKAYTVSEIQNQKPCYDYSNQKLSVTVRKLEERGIVAKDIIEKKAYFKAIPDTKEEALKLVQAAGV